MKKGKLKSAGFRLVGFNIAVGGTEYFANIQDNSETVRLALPTKTGWYIESVQASASVYQTSNSRSVQVVESLFLELDFEDINGNDISRSVSGIENTSSELAAVVNINNVYVNDKKTSYVRMENVFFIEVLRLAAKFPATLENNENLYVDLQVSYREYENGVI